MTHRGWSTARCGAFVLTFFPSCKSPLFARPPPVRCTGCMAARPCSLLCPAATQTGLCGGRAAHRAPRRHVPTVPASSGQLQSLGRCPLHQHRLSAAQPVRRRADAPASAHARPLFGAGARALASRQQPPARVWRITAPTPPPPSTLPAPALRAPTRRRRRAGVPVQAALGHIRSPATLCAPPSPRRRRCVARQPPSKRRSSSTGPRPCKTCTLHTIPHGAGPSLRSPAGGAQHTQRAPGVFSGTCHVAECTLRVLWLI